MHDKSMTKPGGTPRKKPGPVLRVKHGSAVVPIYVSKVRKWTRYTITFHLNGQRTRRTFGSLEKAKTEAQLVARKIQEGLSATNDLSPIQREFFLAAQRLIEPLNTPFVSAVEEYARCRELLGPVPLMTAVEEYVRRTQGMTIGVKVTEIVPEFLAAKVQDNLSKVYLAQLAINLRRFSAHFSGEIMAIKAGEFDRWLRSLGGSPVTRNSVHRSIKVFFSFCKARGYLPSSEATVAELVHLAKEGESKAEIFDPESMTKLFNAASPRVVAFLAIGGFAGLRTAELKRLDWSAVDLDRGIITLRADQAKTASRRIIPVSENLAAWLRPLNRKGRVIECPNVALESTGLAKKLGINWPHNGLRHSYISYRIAQVKDAAKVALEAGNSPEIIFKHYRELVTEEAAKVWFSICPPADWAPDHSPIRRGPRKKRQP
jgi:integrase